MSTAATAPRTRMLRSLPAAVHVRAIAHGGRSDFYITRQARLTTDQFRRVRRGDPVGWDIAHRVLALPIPNEAALYEERDSTGTRRRLRALRALGWPLEDLVAALDWPLHKAGHVFKAATVTIADHLAVCALYDQRWHWLPEEHGIPVEDAAHARLTAQTANYCPPLAWDDATIDNPDSAPVFGRRPKMSKQGREEFGSPDPAAALRALDGDRVLLSAQTRTLAIAYGARYLGMPPEVMAARLGMNEAAVLRSFDRIKKRVRTAANGAPTWVDEPRFTMREPETAA